jgi:molybdate transport system substrate-binding protein
MKKQTWSVGRIAMLISSLLLTWVSSAQAAEVRVAAAASLTDAVSVLVSRYREDHPNIELKVSFAGSSTLAKQIENGAPVDIFLSADKDWVDYLDAKQLLKSGTRKDFLGNSLVIIAPAKRMAAFTLSQESKLIDQLNEKLCTGEPSHVPVGKYAKQALEYYGWWGEVQPVLVGTEDVRAALAFVARGECSMGIVYQTDALLDKRVDIVARFPGDSHSAIVYPGVLTKRAGDEAQQFWDFLQSVAAREIFTAYGFVAAE